MIHTIHIVLVGQHYIPNLDFSPHFSVGTHSKVYTGPWDLSSPWLTFSLNWCISSFFPCEGKMAYNINT